MMSKMLFPMFCRKAIRRLRSSYPCNAGILLVRTLSSNSKILMSKELKKEKLHLSEEVESALHDGKGVVALESTIITHGMPYPHNFSTALSVERMVRESGAVPATIAVLDGKLRVGLSDTELILLAEKSSSLVKISRRDLAFVLSQGLSGGTTVSATMLAAHMAGISVFATGGIGGVHRGAEISFDISADLTELGRTPVAVVSSGVKSILDIGKTLEYLETQGVFVGTLGESNHFPAFFTTDSGFLSPYNIPNVPMAAHIIDRHLSLGLQSGLIFANPIPVECSLPRVEMDAVIRDALNEANDKGITGKAVTPFILDRVNQLTAGSSLKANIALIENNAIAAGTIAYCLALIQRGRTLDEIWADPIVTGMTSRTSSILQDTASPSISSSPSSPSSSTSRSSTFSSSTTPTHQANTLKKHPVVFGASIIDFLVQVQDEHFEMSGATYPGQVFQSFGGVGRNMADCLTRLGMDAKFVSIVGEDSLATTLLAGCSHMDMTNVQRASESFTATYCPVQGPAGQLLFGVGDMAINSVFDPNKVKDLSSILSDASIVLVDGNFTHDAISNVVKKCQQLEIPVWFEPTDIHKAGKPFMSEAWKGLTFTSPNLQELKVMHSALMGKLGKTVSNFDNIRCDTSSVSDVVNVSVSMCRDLIEYTPVVLVTLGHHGVVVCHTFGDVSHLYLDLLHDKHDKEAFRAWWYPAISHPDIVSVSGAGDCLNSGFVSGLHSGSSIDSCITKGLLTASMSLSSHTAVPQSITLSSLLEKETKLGLDIVEKIDVTNGIVR